MAPTRQRVLHFSVAYDTLFGENIELHWSLDGGTFVHTTRFAWNPGCWRGDIKVDIAETPVAILYKYCLTNAATATEEWGPARKLLLDQSTPNHLEIRDIWQVCP